MRAQTRGFLRVWVGSGLVDLHLKGTLKDVSIIIARDYLSLGGAFPPGLVRSQVSKHKNTENKKA